jgi:hypothetical protein
MGDWRKSSYSDGNGGACVETTSVNGVILVRDTTNRDGMALVFNTQAWSAFTAKLKWDTKGIACGIAGAVRARRAGRRHGPSPRPRPAAGHPPTAR